MAPVPRAEECYTVKCKCRGAALHNERVRDCRHDRAMMWML